MKPLLLAVAVLALAAPAWAQTPQTPAPAAAAPAPPYGAPIGLETAQALIGRATAAASARGFRMAFAIVEPSGQLVAFGRMDDTQYGSIAVAQAKARSAALYRTATSVSEERLTGGRTALLALDGMVPVAGGGCPSSWTAGSSARSACREPLRPRTTRSRARPLRRSSGADRGGWTPLRPGARDRHGVFQNL